MTKRWCCFFCPVIVLLLTHSGVAATSPQAISNVLDIREKNLSHLTFDWQNVYKEDDAPVPPQQIKAQQQSAEQQLPAQLKRLGITDEEGIKKEVQAMVEHYAEAGKAASYNSTTKWNFQHYGDQILVNGVRRLDGQGSTQSASQYYRQFYDKNAGLIINDRNDINNISSQTIGSFAWASPSSSPCYRAPFADSLDLIPEHFVMLLSLNPLTMYGAHWKVISETPEDWTLTTEVIQDDWQPFHITLTLSRSHGGAPARIETIVGDNKESIIVQTKSYRRYQEEWIADNVHVSDKWPGLEKDQTWLLTDMKPSHPITVLAPEKDVQDYRLVPTVLHGTVRPQLDGAERGDVISYKWPGKFPSLNELKKLRQQHNPGESSPDPGKTSAALPFLGGVFCLVGGVWMFKRRGLS